MINWINFNQQSAIHLHFEFIRYRFIWRSPVIKISRLTEYQLQTNEIFVDETFLQIHRVNCRPWMEYKRSFNKCIIMHLSGERTVFVTSSPNLDLHAAKKLNLSMEQDAITVLGIGYDY
jgi:hypothetical protein